MDSTLIQEAVKNILNPDNAVRNQADEQLKALRANNGQ